MEIKIYFLIYINFIAHTQKLHNIQNKKCNNLYSEENVCQFLLLHTERRNSEAVYASRKEEQDRNITKTGWTGLLYL